MLTAFRRIALHRDENIPLYTPLMRSPEEGEAIRGGFGRPIALRGSIEIYEHVAPNNEIPLEFP